MPPSCTVLGGFAKGARVELLWQRNANPSYKLASTRDMTTQCEREMLASALYSLVQSAVDLWCCWCQKKPSAQLERVMADLHVESSACDAGSAAGDDDDLLALMDSAAAAPHQTPAVSLATGTRQSQIRSVTQFLVKLLANKDALSGTVGAVAVEHEGHKPWPPTSKMSLTCIFRCKVFYFYSKLICTAFAVRLSSLTVLLVLRVSILR